MEDIMEILEDVIYERLELAYFELIKEDEEVKENVEEVKKLEIGLCDNNIIPREVKRQIEDYKDISYLIERKMQKIVYKAGITDCLKLLIKLGMLR